MSVETKYLFLSTSIKSPVKRPKSSLVTKAHFPSQPTIYKIPKTSHGNNHPPTPSKARRRYSPHWYEYAQISPSSEHLNSHTIMNTGAAYGISEDLLPNPFRTPGVQNIEKRYSSGGGSKNHLPGAATKRGDSDSVVGNTETAKGIGSPHHEAHIQGQKPDVSAHVFFWELRDFSWAKESL